jgi:MFS family permease
VSDDPRRPPSAGPAQELRDRASLLALAFLIMVASSGTWHSFSVFYVALLEDTGWDRSSTAGVFSVMVLAHGATGIWFGALTDRLGARQVILLGGAILAAGLLLDTQVRALAPLPVPRPRGGDRAGGRRVDPVHRRHASLLSPEPRHGHRDRLGRSRPRHRHRRPPEPGAHPLVRVAPGMLAGLVLAVAVPLALVGLRGPYGDRAPRPEVSPEATRAERGPSLRTAVRDARFWALTAGGALMSFGVQTLTVHHVAALVDAGVTAMMAASTIGVMGVTSIPAKIGWGWLADRLGRPLTFGLGTLVFLLAVVRLGTVAASTSGGVVLDGILIGLGYSMSATLPPVLTADLFRGSRYGAIFGTVNFLAQLGGAFGVWFAGFLHDLTGSYRLPLVLAAAAALVAADVVNWAMAPGRWRWR